MEESSMLKALRKHLANQTPEERTEMIEHFRDKTPKGWNSIEDYLPMMKIKDLMQGYSVFKVRNTSGEEFKSCVADHNTWYYRAKDDGITEWFNE